ncbi:VOC family protein [Amycolatopsis sp. CA-128772]|uniref:VOC family protein n=1 Tax=Amycolatopsis sp. CA-128772 TaxID=2073159 RepID=UPI00351A03B7
MAEPPTAYWRAEGCGLRRTPNDLAAEVARLTASGAEPVSGWLDVHTLRAPGGHLFCVVPLHSKPETFAASAHTWP